MPESDPHPLRRSHPPLLAAIRPDHSAVVSWPVRSFLQRQLAAVAAVIGREFEFALLRRASGCDEAAAADGVEELVRRGVLEGTDDQFDFTHDRIRTVVDAALLQPQRKLLHRQIGSAIETLHADDLETHSAALGTHYRAGEV